MLDLLELTYGRYEGGNTAPIGWYLNPRTMSLYQLAADGVLPACGTFVRIYATGGDTLANAEAAAATAMNTTLGTTIYVSGSFHQEGGSDLLSAVYGSQGKMTDDA